MDVQITIDSETCVGYGECVTEGPEAVALDDTGCARVRVATIPFDQAQRICAACPVGAITFTPAMEPAA